MPKIQEWKLTVIGLGLAILSSLSLALFLIIPPDEPLLPPSLIDFEPLGMKALSLAASIFYFFFSAMYLKEAKK